MQKRPFQHYRRDLVVYLATNEPCSFRELHQWMIHDHNDPDKERLWSLLSNAQRDDLIYRTGDGAYALTLKGRQYAPVYRKNLMKVRGKQLKESAHAVFNA